MGALEGWPTPSGRRSESYSVREGAPHALDIEPNTIYAEVGMDVGKGRTMGKSEIDERGRVTIPKEVREKAGLKAGDKLLLTADNKRVIMEKVVNLDRFIQELKGCITVQGDLDPLKLKEIWRTAE